MKQPSAAALIQLWGGLQRSALNKSSAITWEPADLLLAAALKDAAVFESKLRDLVRKSSEVLSPLCDPLLTDLGMHRWLRAEREEAYSDWLKWVLDQLSDGEAVLRLLRIRDRKLLDYCHNKKLTILREVVIEQGRLDLVLRSGNDFLMIIEVKTVTAEKADVQKQHGYSKWLSNQSTTHKAPSILLVVAAQDEDYYGFVPLLWEDFCIELRRIIPDLFVTLGISKAALMLAFVGAVEANLLNLSVPQEGLEAHRLTFGRTMRHLERSMAKERNDE